MFGENKLTGRPTRLDRNEETGIAILEIATADATYRLRAQGGIATSLARQVSPGVQAIIVSLAGDEIVAFAIPQVPPPQRPT